MKNRIFVATQTQKYKESINMILIMYIEISVISQAEISTTSSRHHQEDYDISLDQLLQDKSKNGVFEADFENVNNTIVNVRDGDSVLLNCRVYLLHDKTVSVINILFHKIKVRRQ